MEDLSHFDLTGNLTFMNLFFSLVEEVLEVASFDRFRQVQTRFNEIRRIQASFDNFILVLQA